jgi:ribosome-associated heat shock protein Hsp15
MADEGGDGVPDSIRLDRWLWYARFFRSRTLAARACADGAIRIDGVAGGRAHAAVRSGQVLTFVQGHHIRVIEVVALGTRRGPASEARSLYRDRAPPLPKDARPENAPENALPRRGIGRAR